MKIKNKTGLAFLLITIALTSYSQTHAISTGSTVRWYKIGSLAGDAAGVSIKVTATPGYGGAVDSSGETWGKVSIGNADDEFGGWFTEVGGKGSSSNEVGWVKTGTKNIDVYFKAAGFNRGTIHVFDGHGFTSNFSSTTTDPGITSVANTFNFVSGNVGIGTSGPDAKLEVTGTLGEAELILNSIDANPDLRFNAEAKDKVGLVYDRNTDAFKIHVNDGGISFTENSLVVADGGNVGIGTSNPLRTLHIKNSGNNGKMLSESKQPGVILKEIDATPDENWWIDSNSGAFRILTVNDALSDWSTALSITQTSGDPDLFKVNADDIGLMGNVGIGTNSPEEFLHSKGSVLVENGATSSGGNRNAGVYTWKDNAYGMELHYASARWGTAVFARNGSDIRLGHYAADETEQDNLDIKMIVKYDGSIGIGTTSPDQKLTVKGKIHAEEVIVDLSVPGPDYVFADNYPLTTLQEVEDYIQQNKHLPEIPSAREMEANGVELGTMNMLLLKKIEELTLYTLEQEKEIEKLKLAIEHKGKSKEVIGNQQQMARTIEELLSRIEKLETEK